MAEPVAGVKLRECRMKNTSVENVIETATQKKKNDDKSPAAEKKKKRSTGKEDEIDDDQIEYPTPKAKTKYAGSAGQKAGLAAVEKASRLWLFENPDRRVAPEVSHVLATLRLLGTEWPTQMRPNVTTSGQPVSGMCLGLVMALGQGAQCSYLTDCFPYTTKYLTRFCTTTLPKTKAGKLFPFSSLQINFNYAAAKHVDGNNIGPSYIMSIGSHTGGALWTADQGVIQCHNKWKLFDGNQEHYTMDFAPKEDGIYPGERISFIAFAHGLYSKLEPFVVKQLKGLGFTAARSDGKDYDFFIRHRIEKNYLSEENNEKFKEELKVRQQEKDPRATLTKVGDVAIECYGRQAIRGGGWMALKPSDSEPPLILNLTENSVGIWMAELRWTPSGTLALDKHDRLNFYADPKSTTTKFKQRILNLPKGTPVMLGIADTAIAASRPLQKSFYDILKNHLGAPVDMPEIKYRVAWALIGFKGAPSGSAFTAIGTRSTLLRLDANFQFIRPGVTNLTPNAKPDLTSIIDVVAGTGQDCAVANNIDDDNQAPAAKKPRIAP